MPGDTIQPPRRTPFIDIANRTFAIGQGAGIMDRSVLDKGALMDRAADEAGLSDFGDPWFERPLEVLLDALKGEAQLNRSGEFTAEKTVLKVLRDRLWAARWFEDHPEILARPLPHPVAVVGPMRSGTTRMHRLLASDHRFSSLRSFETISPVPRPDTAPGEDDARRVGIARNIMRMARLANPRTLSIHPTGPFETEEELGLLVNSFWGMKHEAQWMIPSYAKWSDETDPRPAYEQMARLLRLVSWTQSESSLRPWILKTPQYMLDLDTVIDTFPDARLIFTHRDPLAVVGSAASLAWNQTILYSDEADAHEMGELWLAKTRRQIENMRAARERLDADRKIDVHYEEMESDWEGTMARIYRFLGMDIAPALPAMHAYVERAAMHKRRPHKYSLSEFGLTEDDVMAELGDYVRTYGITLENGQAKRRATS